MLALNFIVLTFSSKNRGIIVVEGFYAQVYTYIYVLYLCIYLRIHTLYTDIAMVILYYSKNIIMCK